MNEIGNYKVKTKLEKKYKSEVTMMSDLTIWFVLSGYVEMNRNGSMLSLRTGDIYIFNRGDLVSVNESKDNHTLSVKIGVSRYERPFPNFKLSLPISEVYKSEAYNYMKQCLANIYYEQLRKDKGSAYIIEGQSTRLIGLLYRYLETEKRELEHDPSYSEKIKNVVSYIDQHYDEKLTLDHLAEKFYSSKYYLARLFKKQLGTTIGNYIKEVRLLHGVKMLEETDRKVIDIALANGFPNLRSFIEAVKDKYQVTPQELRERHEKNKKITEIPIQSDEVLDLLDSFVPLHEFSNPSLHGTKTTVPINPYDTIGKFHPLNRFLKCTTIPPINRLKEINQKLRVQLVSVTNIVKKIDYVVENGEFIYNFQSLDVLLRQIIDAGMKPYIQFQSIDYFEWKKNGAGNDGMFLKLLRQLHYHIQQNFANTQDWYIEFRCFHETNNYMEVIRPLVNAISIFQGYNFLFIHLPVVPEENLSTSDSDRGVYCIDDFTKVTKMELEQVYEYLNDSHYVKEISQDMHHDQLNHALERTITIENDTHQAHYANLKHANGLLWNALNDIETAPNRLSPLSLDGANLFEYFPSELAERFSILTKDGRIKEYYYALAFLNNLYEDIVFKNENCIVTRYQENYRILAVYPEEELRQLLVKSNQYKHNKKKLHNSFIQIELQCKDLFGTYRFVKQQLSPEHIDKKAELAYFRKCKKLSSDDIEYWNGINRPVRTVETLEMKRTYTLEFQVPMFGITMIDLEKTYE
ncbi:AraC-like DNA-binding protein [Gracilibacillus halotolerans]|uniref:AraC-like DNA-binding protein n=1 Tax=Gracilibacillus halotolerans TaxID=74386 RepID=A0A841RNZ3_9BACI|nr:AraC family transcriptional regulator [Gracilibacillus halotolerans]MBB6513597.1 AraC-like DNA-binding protein [Gracilibacillus halotolerans]